MCLPERIFGSIGVPGAECGKMAAYVVGVMVLFTFIHGFGGVLFLVGEL
jgi:hypothetical protein